MKNSVHVLGLGSIGTLFAYYMKSAGIPVCHHVSMAQIIALLPEADGSTLLSLSRASIIVERLTIEAARNKAFLSML
jgi:ketopantoate reductase